MIEHKGKEVIVMCANYIYAGKLVDVTHDAVLLSEPSIVYETGDFGDAKWKDAQLLPVEGNFHIERSAVESMGLVRRRST